MPNPYTFVNWGVLGVTDKESRHTNMPGYNIYIWEEILHKSRRWVDWSGTINVALSRMKIPDFTENKKYLGYATPTEAKQFFKTMIYRIERHNETTPLKVNKIRFLKKFSVEPNWKKLDMGMICYSWTQGKHAWGQNISHRAYIYFEPVIPSFIKEEMEELNYTLYGL